MTPLNKQSGFSIIEAMIAMLIMTFGLLAVSGMQITLAKGGDISRQQSEATRLAQEKMEQLRSYTQINTATNVISWDGLTSGSDTITTNAVYTRRWTFGGTIDDAQRPVSINVTWVDRASTTQGITITSVIAQINPKDIAQLGYPLPQNTNLKPVKNRSLDIPIPATTLNIDSNKSSYYVSGLGGSIVFDNSDGSVVYFCSNYQVSANVTAQQLSNNCTSIEGVILTGYVYDPLVGQSYSYSYIGEVATSNTTYVYNTAIQPLYACTKNGATTLYHLSSCPSGYSQSGSTSYYNATSTLSSCTGGGNTYYMAPTGTCPAKIGGTDYTQGSSYTAYFSSTTTVTTVTSTISGTTNYTGISTGSSAIDTSGISFVDTSTNTATTSRTISCAVSGAVDQTSGSSIANYKSYICLIYTGTNVGWSGSIKFKNIFKYNYFLNCGLSYASTTANSNQKHPSYYNTVTYSLDNQNYYIYTADSSAQTNNSTAKCNTSTAVFSNWLNTTAFVQQDCRNIASNSSLLSNCP